MHTCNFREMQESANARRTKHQESCNKDSYTQGSYAALLKIRDGVGHNMSCLTSRAHTSHKVSH